MTHKWAWPFNEPVNAEALGLSDYYEVITTPMDLGTVKSRLEAGAYHRPEDVAADIRLVFANACAYNASGARDARLSGRLA